MQTTGEWLLWLHQEPGKVIQTIFSGGFSMLTQTPMSLIYCLQCVHPLAIGILDTNKTTFSNLGGRKMTEQIVNGFARNFSISFSLKQQLRNLLWSSTLYNIISVYNSYVFCLEGCIIVWLRHNNFSMLPSGHDKYLPSFMTNVCLSSDHSSNFFIESSEKE